MTKCSQCGKKPMKAVKRKLLRGHYNPTKVYRQKPNLQWAKVNGKRIKMCTDCIKTLNKAAHV
jgi:ribosomal protein L28